jgi:dolichol-phosphate mannosyltransferase
MSRGHYDAALGFVKGVGEAQPPYSRRLLVCIPTYNEAENIGPFIDAVFKNVPPEACVLVVDDNSPDDTARIVEKAVEKTSRKITKVEPPRKAGACGGVLGRI